MLIGVSSCPWESDQKLLQQVYQKYITIPRAEYSSRFCAWSHLLGRYSALSWKFDTSVMSKISDGYTIGKQKTFVSDNVLEAHFQLIIDCLSFLFLFSQCYLLPYYDTRVNIVDQ